MANFNDYLAIIIPCTLLGIGVPAFLIYNYFLNKRLQTLYADLVVRKFPEKGDVHLNYTTYHGLLVYATQTTYDFWLKPDDARTLLDRLLYFNFTWGAVVLLFFFVHPINLWNYFWQRQSIASQEAAGSAQPMSAEVIPEQYDDRPPADPSNPYNAPRTDNPTFNPVAAPVPQVPLVYRGLGAIMMLVGLLGIIGVAVAIVTETKQIKWGEMTGALVVVGLLTAGGYVINTRGL